MTTQAKHILVVDDEEKLLQTIAQRLKVLGFVPFTASNGMTAIEIAQNNPIDIAIVDLQMPDMDGLVTITKLKEIKPGAFAGDRAGRKNRDWGSFPELRTGALQPER